MIYRYKNNSLIHFLAIDQIRSKIVVIKNTASLLVNFRLLLQDQSLILTLIHLAPTLTAVLLGKGHFSSQPGLALELLPFSCAVYALVGRFYLEIGRISGR